MTNARTSNRLIRLAAAGLAGAAAIVLPLAGTAGAAFEPLDPAVVSPASPIQVTPGTVSSVDGTLKVTTATNASSELSILPLGIQNKLFVNDENAPLKPGAGCSTYADWGIVCNEAYTFEINTGNFNDTVLLDANYGDSYIHAGSGNDTVTGGKGTDWIWAEAGKDVLFGGDGPDVLMGGKDNDYDRITGGLGKNACYDANYYEDCYGILDTKDTPR